MADHLVSNLAHKLLCNAESACPTAHGLEIRPSIGLQHVGKVSPKQDARVMMEDRMAWGMAGCMGPADLWYSNEVQGARGFLRIRLQQPLFVHLRMQIGEASEPLTSHSTCLSKVPS